MIGQHPELYGFPELHLFSTETVEEIIKTKYQRGKIASPGLLRTLAQEHDGIQSTETVLKAMEWLIARKDWTTKQLFNYLTELINPKIGVEKTPNTSKKKKYLQRAYNFYPDAYFLHLTRHPLATRKSIVEFAENRTQKQNKSNISSVKNSPEGLLIWYYMHRNIINFLKTLPVGQTMRIKGEDLLSYPDLYLPQIAEWLDISTESNAINSMKHPEKSPYAYIGPFPCPGGNDPKFMRSPTLRNGVVKEPYLETFLEKKQWQPEEIKKIATSTDEFKHKVLKLSNLLGYN
jgi:hypothetical protein